MAPLGDILFWNNRGPALDDVLRYNAEQLRAKVDELDDSIFDKQEDGEIVAFLMKSESIQALSIDLNLATPHVRETQIEVSDDYGFSGRGRVKVRGLEATKAIPFTGDPNLWSLRPNPFDLNPPRGIIQGNSLVVGITVREQQTEDAKRYIGETIATVVTNLERQRSQIDAFNNSISGLAMPLIQQRRARRGKASDLLNSLR